jgi:hypothetical protein
MFVVKSDLMKVVDIKVSLVETVRIFSLMSCNTKSEAGVPPAALNNVLGDGIMTSQKPRRKLVNTHVAKGYVPPQSEESYANDNHLKGSNEGYEDVRIAKSLSMYKLAMLIPVMLLEIKNRQHVANPVHFCLRYCLSSFRSTR